MDQGFHCLPSTFQPPLQREAGHLAVQKEWSQTKSSKYPPALFFTWQQHPLFGYWARHRCQDKRRAGFGKLINVVLAEHFRSTSHLAILTELRCARPASITCMIPFNIPQITSVDF